MTNEEILQTKIIITDSSRLYARTERESSGELLLDEEVIDYIEVLMDIARADERAKVMAEMKETMDKLCPLANPNTKG